MPGGNELRVAARGGFAREYHAGTAYHSVRHRKRQALRRIGQQYFDHRGRESFRASSISDNVTLDSSGAAGTFASVNAGSNIPVAASGFTLAGSKASDYSLSQPAGLSANIIPAVVTATITGNPTKAYDGSNSATLTDSDYHLRGFVGAQGAAVQQSATANYLSPNTSYGVGLLSTLVISDFVADAGINLANYSMPSTGTGVLGTITPKVLNLTGTRVYDTTTNADGSLFGTLTGLNGDTLSVSGVGTLPSKNVGTETFTFYLEASR